MISLKLIDSIADITQNINSGLAEELNKRITSSSGKIISRCRPIVHEWIMSSPEVQSLSSSDPNSLAGLLGIPVIEQASIKQTIAKAVAMSTEVNVRKFNKSLNDGGITVNFQPDSFVNLLGLPEGRVIDTGLNLHWMRWLLELGDTTIVTQYSYDPSTGRGRSGHGTMSIGSGFRIPPQFSGTSKNNFITRALSGSKQVAQIEKILKEIL